MALVDIVLTYDCNLGCDYCTIGSDMRGRSLGTGAVLSAMRRGHSAGFDAVSFTGGEPTIVRELPRLVRAARDLGYAEIKIQSNGLLLAHAPNVDRLVAAGANLFHVSIQTHDKDAYDELVRCPGAYALMAAALDNLVARRVRLRADVILKSDTYRKLPDAVRWLSARGVSMADLWFVSLTDGNRDNVTSMPRMTEVVPWMREAFAIGRELGMTIRSLHVPRCLLGDDACCAYDPGSERVMVVTPEATFELHDSKLAGQQQVSSCRGCRYERICPGLRPDYVARYGDSEINAVGAG
jgi:MoaA/NifB/PqqE/SkfB family radical SAM enzyme